MRTSCRKAGRTTTAGPVGRRTCRRRSLRRSRVSRDTQGCRNSLRARRNRAGSARWRWPPRTRRSCIRAGCRSRRRRRSATSHRRCAAVRWPVRRSSTSHRRHRRPRRSARRTRSRRRSRRETRSRARPRPGRSETARRGDPTPTTPSSRRSSCPRTSAWQWERRPSGPSSGPVRSRGPGRRGGPPRLAAARSRCRVRRRCRGGTPAWQWR